MTPPHIWENVLVHSATLITPDRRQSALFTGRTRPDFRTVSAVSLLTRGRAAINSGYIPEQKYVRALLENLHETSEDGDVVIHWDAIRQRS